MLKSYIISFISLHINGECNLNNGADFLIVIKVQECYVSFVFLVPPNISYHMYHSHTNVLQERLIYNERKGKIHVMSLCVIIDLKPYILSYSLQNTDEEDVAEALEGKT